MCDVLKMKGKRCHVRRDKMRDACDRAEKVRSAELGVGEEALNAENGEQRARRLGSGARGCMLALNTGEQGVGKFCAFRRPEL